ncbi:MULTISPECIES: tyrosine-type recombinase/integrase [Paraburkholderia]|uniref:Integrase family protein n=1 Tax=Paraburkholderia podalyriae TaxID=1938811 RepID=A0ABR7PQH6_9BURK|nr:integrase family protein [Paraburkholderia podalyriae]MBC8748538.1 integrase family protein [Paraburkholderia podalyriae]
MAKVNFTAGRINGHSCPAGKSQSFIWDSGASGLGLRATAAGASTYIWQGKLHGGTVRVSIGDPKDWGIDDARDEARRLQRLVDAGKDPREEAAEQRVAHEARRVEARRKSATVGEAWADYLEYLKTAISPKTKQSRSPRYIADHVALAAQGGESRKRGKGKTVRGPLAPLMPLKLFDITARRVAEWLADEAAERPTNAAHAYRLLKAFIRWCDGQDDYAGVIPDGAYDSPKVTAVLPQSKAKKGDSLQREQLPAWFSAVRQLGNPVISAYLQALLLTGARREEMTGLRWDDVDFRWASLTIADKVDGSRVIPLPPYLAGLLLELKRLNDTPPNVRQLARLKARGEAWEPSSWVFTSVTAASGHIEEPRFQHKQALQAAGLPHVTLHGLRRSFGTLSEWVECPVGVVAQIQGHKPSAIAEKHYRRRPLDLLRVWHNRIEAWVLEQAGIDFKPEQSQQGLHAVSQ